MNYEIHTYGTGQFLHSVFNYVAMIFNNSSFFVLMNAIALLAFIGALAKVTISRDGLHVVRSYFAVVFLVMIAFFPKVDVVIVDDIVPANSRIVSNVPFGLGFTASTFSKIGYWLTNTYETVTAIPGFGQTTATGFLFHQEMFHKAENARLSGMYAKYNFNQFVHSCVIVDGVGHDRFTWEDLMSAPNIDTFLKQNLSNADVAQFYYVPHSPNAKASDKKLATCKDGYEKIISPNITVNTLESIKKLSLPYAEKFPTLAEANNFVGGKLQGVINFMYRGSAGNYVDFMRQKLLVNELDNSVQIFSQGVNDTNLMNLIQTKAERERQLTFDATLKMAVDKLPKLKIIIEGVLYAIFPIIALLAIASPAKVALGYTKALIWINLWSPMFAVLNGIRIFFDERNLANITAFYNGNSAMAMLEVNQYLAEANNITGGLMISLPMITWMLLTMSGAMMAGFAGRVLGGFESSVQGASSEVADGKAVIDGKNVSFSSGSNAIMASNTESGGFDAMSGQSPLGATANSAITADTPGFSPNPATSNRPVSTTFTDSMGNQTQITSGSGDGLVPNVVNTQMPTTSGLFDYKISQSTVNEYKSAVTEAESFTEQAKNDFSVAQTAELGVIQQVGQAVTQQASRTDQTQHSSEQSMQKAHDILTQNAQTYLNSTGRTDITATQLGAELGLRMKIGGGVSGRTSNSSSNTEVEQLATQFMKSDQFKSTQAQVSRYMTSESFQEQTGVSKDLIHSLKAQQSVRVAANQAVSEAQATQETVQQQYASAVQFNSTEASERSSAMLKTWVDMGNSTESFTQLHYDAYHYNDADAKATLDELASTTVSSYAQQTKEDINADYNANKEQLIKKGNDSIVEFTKKASYAVDARGEQQRAIVSGKGSESGLNIENKPDSSIKTVKVGKVGVEASPHSVPTGLTKPESTIGRVADNSVNIITDTAEVVRDKAVDVTADAVEKAKETAEVIKEKPITGGTTALAGAFIVSNGLYNAGKNFVDDVRDKLDQKQEQKNNQGETRDTFDGTR